MFTGIIEEVGTVRGLMAGGLKARLTVDAPATAPQVEPGDSVAVNGVCLTVSGIATDQLTFDIVTETLRRSTLGGLKSGGRVNLEGALRVGDRLSGHFVMGHVDGVGQVVRRSDDPGQLTLRIRAPAEVKKYLLEKGSIAVNGVSLTIWEVRGPEFSVALVPHTRSLTTLEQLARGDSVNLEADVLARWVARLVLPGGGDGLTIEKLRDAGWNV